MARVLPTLTLMRPLLAAALCLLAAGCATPARPTVSWYVNPEPMKIPQEPVPYGGSRTRKITPPPVPAPMCLTDRDFQALSTYLDQIDAARSRAGR